MKMTPQTAPRDSDVDVITLTKSDMFILPPYSTLVNDKIIVPSSSTPYFAVEQHFFFNCMKSIVQNIFVDEQWYLTHYSDVKDAIRDGKVASAKEHYARFGYYEHRIPYHIDVDAPWYLETYPDVHQSISKRNFSSASGHFEEVGYKEGRLPYAGFQLKLDRPYY